MVTKSKKAQIQEIITLFVVIFAVGITILLGRYILTEFYDAIDDSGITQTQEMNDTQNEINTSFLGFDYAMVVLVAVIIIGLMITSFMIPTHPIFIVVNIIGIFFLVFLGMVLNNVYGEIVAGEDEVLGTQADEYSLLNYLITKLPYIGAIVIFVTSVIMYSRNL